MGADEPGTHRDAHGLVHLFSDQTLEPALLDLMARRNVFVITTLSVIAADGGHAGADALTGHPQIPPYLEPQQIQSLTFAVILASSERRGHVAARTDR